MDNVLTNVHWIVFSPHGDRCTDIAEVMNVEKLVECLSAGTLDIPVADSDEETCLLFDTEKEPVCISIMNSVSTDTSEHYLCRTDDDIVIASIRNNKDLVSPFYDAYLAGKVASQKEFLAIYYNEGLIL